MRRRDWLRYLMILAVLSGVGSRARGARGAELRAGWVLLRTDR